MLPQKNLEPTTTDPSSPTATQWVQRGYTILIGLVTGLLGFTMAFSISGAVVASGTVTVEGNYKTVQHLDGGIIANILVRNGDVVQKGDILARLDSTEVKANLAILQARIRNMLIQQSRLVAERDRKPKFKLPHAVVPHLKTADVRDAIAAESALFKARNASRIGEISVMREKIAQLNAQRNSLLRQLSSRREELSITLRERNTIRPLYRKGFTNSQRFNSVERAHAQVEGDIARMEGELARITSSLAEIGLSIAQTEKQFTQAVVDELAKVRAQLLELDEQRKTHADKLQRIEIRAPHAGRIHALQIHTEGGVLSPASPIMQVIPYDGRLIIEARVDPKDVDKVRKGNSARLRFSSLATHTTPTLVGIVKHVSAAELSTTNGTTYFTAQIEVNPGEEHKIGGRDRLVPGMPAEIFIETGARSIMSYLVKPLTDAMMRAFRES